MKLATIPAALHLKWKHRSGATDPLFSLSEAGRGAGNDPSHFGFPLCKLAVDPSNAVVLGQGIQRYVVVHFDEHLQALRRSPTPNKTQPAKLKRRVLPPAVCIISKNKTRQRTNLTKKLCSQLRFPASCAASIGLRPRLDFLGAVSQDLFVVSS